MAILAVASTGALRHPSILGTSHIAIYISNAAAAEHFFTFVVGAAKLPDPEDARGACYAVSVTKFIEVLPQPVATIASLRSTVSDFTDEDDWIAAGSKKGSKAQNNSCRFAHGPPVPQ